MRGEWRVCAFLLLCLFDLGPADKVKVKIVDGSERVLREVPAGHEVIFGSDGEAKTRSRLEEDGTAHTRRKRQQILVEEEVQFDDEGNKVRGKTTVMCSKKI